MSTHVPKTDPAHIKGLRSIAVIEITKGILVLLGAIALIILIRRDVNFQDVALSILNFLHIDPDRRLAERFLDAAGQASDMHASFIGLAACVYSTIRFIEGYGLWCARVWAEWMALISGAIYLPLEIKAILNRSTWLHWSFLITNLVILAYIAWVRFGEKRVKAHHLRTDVERAN
jgi:uncharacterized membrane protein (DUF2068 family)